MGHLCDRDCLLFLAECIIDGNQGEGEDVTPTNSNLLDISIPSFNGGFRTPMASPFTGAAGFTQGMTPLGGDPNNISTNQEYNYFKSAPSPSFHRSLTIARKTLILQKIEF